MKWFSRFTGDSQGQALPASSASKRRSSDDSEAAQLLQQASQALEQLKTARQGDFPLLNQATRLVQQVEGCVAGMKDTDQKLAWRSQVEELQRELRIATGRMLASHSPPAAPAAGLSARPPAPAAALATHTAPAPARPADLGAADDLDLFSGLDLAGGGGAQPSSPAPVPYAAPVQPVAPPALAVHEAASQLAEVASGIAPLDEELFTSLSEPEPLQPLAPAPAAGAPSPPAAMGPALEAYPAQPTHAPPAAAPPAHHVGGPPASLPQWAAAPGLLPTQDVQQGSAAPGVRRKKVIRSRIGYARADQPQQAAALPLFAPPPPPAVAAPLPAAPTAAALARPASVASECGSPAHSEGGESNPSFAMGRRASGAASEQGGGKGSRAPTPSESYDSPRPPSLGQFQQPYGSTGSLGAGSEGAGAAGGDGIQLTGQEQDAVLDAAGGLAAQLRRGMNLALEVPVRGPAHPAQSTGSADSTVAMCGIAGGGGYDSDDSITSPEYRPPASRPIPPSPPAVSTDAGAAAAGDGHLLGSSAAAGAALSLPPAAAVTAAAAAAPAAVAMAAPTGAYSLGTVSSGSLAAYSPKTTGSLGSSPPRSPSRFSSLGEQVAALQISLQQQAGELAALMAQQAQQERAAKADRLQLGSEIATLTVKLDKLREAEAGAVQREDFEAAASLGDELDAASAHLAGLQQRLKGAERDARAAAALRVQLQQRQAELWAQAAGRLRGLREAQRDRISQAHQLADKASRDATAAEAAAQERLAELRGNIAERQRVVAEQQASVDRKLAAATGALAQEREGEEAACATLAAEVEELRAALAAKEAELEARQQALAGVEAKIAGLAAKFDKSLALIEEDRRLVATYQQDLEEEEEAVAAAQQEASAAQRAMQQQADTLAQQLAEAEQAGQAIEAEAARLQARADADQHIMQLHAELQQAQLAAEGRVAEAEASAAQLHERQGDLAGRRAALQHELGTAERRAASARLRVPELEAQKKAAAAVRDFKEAARLSAEAKAAAAEAEAAGQQIESLREQLAGLVEEERELAVRADQAEGAVEGARREAARAKWRSIKAAQASLEKQLQQASEVEQYHEAEALQVELDSLAAEGASLARAHGFQDADAAEVVADVAAAADAAAGPAPAPVVLGGGVLLPELATGATAPAAGQEAAALVLPSLMEVGDLHSDLAASAEGSSDVAAAAEQDLPPLGSGFLAEQCSDGSSGSAPAQEAGSSSGGATPAAATVYLEQQPDGERLGYAEQQRQQEDDGAGKRLVEVLAEAQGEVETEQPPPALPHFTLADGLSEGLSLSNSQVSLEGSVGSAQQQELEPTPRQEGEDEEQPQEPAVAAAPTEDFAAPEPGQAAAGSAEPIADHQAESGEPGRVAQPAGAYEEGLLGRSSDEEDEGTTEGCSIPVAVRPVAVAASAAAPAEPAVPPTAAAGGQEAGDMDDLFSGLNLS